MVCNLFASIIFLSLQHKIDMEEVLSYPLTPIPLSLCHMEGLKETTPKVKFLHKLESCIPIDMLPNIDATVIDATFFLHQQKTISGLSGALSSYLLTRICAEKGNELHMVYDNVQSPSIKDCEREERSKNVSRESNYQITGPGQHTPSNWLEALRNDNFKVSLNNFLVDIWKNDCFGGIMSQMEIFVICLRYAMEKWLE